MENSLCHVSTKATPPESCDDCGAGGAVFSTMFEGFLCGPCLRKWQVRDANRRQKELEQHYEHLRICGHNPPLSYCDFAKSSREIESLNQGAWDTARSWTGATNIYVYGPVGTGKTFLASCVLLERIKRLQDVAVVSGPAFVQTATSFRDSENKVKLWSRVPFLHLDDLDKATWTFPTLSALWSLLDDRWKARRRNVITANFAPELLQELWRSKVPDNFSIADAILDRLKPCTVLELNGETQRRNTTTKGDPTP